MMIYPQLAIDELTKRVSENDVIATGR